MVLFWSLDRFSREGVTETLNHLQKLNAAGVQFKSFTEQYLDSTGVFKDAIIAILAAIAKQERVRFPERIKAGQARSSKKPGRPQLAATAVAELRQLRGEGLTKYSYLPAGLLDSLISYDLISYDKHSEPTGTARYRYVY